MFDAAHWLRGLLMPRAKYASVPPNRFFARYRSMAKRSAKPQMGDELAESFVRELAKRFAERLASDPRKLWQQLAIVDEGGEELYRLDIPSIH
jgi:hypothetical protein